MDHIYIITCTKYLDRISYLYKELNRVDINVNDDFVTKIQNINTPLYDILNSRFIANDQTVKTNIGLFITTITNYYCIKNALENGYSKILIFEDDVRFLKNKIKIKNILEESIKIFNDDIGQILCCSGSTLYGNITNGEDAGNDYDIPYLQNVVNMLY